MNADMIEYLANMERRVNKLADQIEELKNIMIETFRKEGGSQICPHKYEWVQSVTHDTTEIQTYVVNCVVKLLKSLLIRANKRKVLLQQKHTGKMCKISQNSLKKCD